MSAACACIAVAAVRSISDRSRSGSRASSAVAMTMSASQSGGTSSSMTWMSNDSGRDDDESVVTAEIEQPPERRELIRDTSMLDSRRPWAARSSLT